jgi:hypothetical protein
MQFSWVRIDITVVVVVGIVPRLVVGQELIHVCVYTRKLEEGVGAVVAVLVVVVREGHCESTVRIDVTVSHGNYSLVESRIVSCGGISRRSQRRGCK